MFKYVVCILLVCLLVLSACSSKTPSTTPSTDQAAASTAAPQGPAAVQPADSAKADVPRTVEPPKEVPKPEPIVLPAGTVFTVRLADQVGSKISSSGQVFQASLAQPISHKEKVVVPSGTSFYGKVLDAKPAGKFKGGAQLALDLNSMVIDGKTIPIRTAGVAEQSKGKGKRTATMVGGGAGAGALIGGLAGGGKGAAIGALVGAGAGTAGAAFTGGDRDIVLPAETALSFKLVEPVQLTPQ